MASCTERTEEACSAKQKRDELKKPHTAASMKKREKEKEKKHTHTEQEKTQNQWARLNDPTVDVSAVTHGLVATVTRRNTNLPFLSLGELRKKGTRAEATLLPLRRCRQAAGKGGRERRSVRKKKEKERSPIINPTVRG